MKIGILTFHMAHNCGAMLQAFSLCSFLNSFSNVSCEIIDYRLPEIYKKYESILQQAFVEPKRLKFEKYLNEVLPLSKRINSLNHANLYDLYIVGSDQVWNRAITQGYKEEYFAEKFPENSFCISYAASTGTKIEFPYDFVRKLNCFKFVSVRESWLKKDLEPYYSKEIKLCLDPVFLMDKNAWDFHVGSLDISNYILIYSFDITENEYLKIEAWAIQNSVNIIELVTHKRFMRKNISYIDDYGPKEWVQYIKNASYVFTDSYHCSLFSIIYDIPFFCMSHDLLPNERVADIVYLLKMDQSNEGFYLSSKETPFEINKAKIKSSCYLKEIIKQVQNEKTNI